MWLPQVLAVADGSFIMVHKLSSCRCVGVLAPRPGIEPAPPAWPGGFLTIGPLVKSLKSSFSFFSSKNWR